MVFLFRNSNHLWLDETRRARCGDDDIRLRHDLGQRVAHTHDILAGQSGLRRDLAVDRHRVGSGNEPPMTWSCENQDAGYMLSTLMDPWLLYPLITSLKSPRHVLGWPAWGRTLGVMIKIKDDISGGVMIDGEISKPMTDQDRFRLNHGAIVARRILLRAGADPDSIFITPLRGTHPSGTVRLGEMLDENLQTEVKNLYVCDASTFPEALDRPTVLTIIALGKRLAAHLLASTDGR